LLLMSVEIPIHVALVRDFVNTLEVDTGDDALAEPGAVEAWFGDRGLVTGDLSAADGRRAIRLREALRDLLLANNHAGHDAQGARRVVEACGRRAKLALRFSESGELVPVPTAGGIDGALGGIVSEAARSMQDGTWGRLKACRAEGCQWAYFDRTRNRSRAWCSMEVCGNREKVRAYRTRHETA
jgi:predicted RNA-binding Zn ribbon-like protein